jgi:hypothetical protein
MTFNPNNDRQFAHQTQSALKDGWYPVVLIGARWFSGSQYNRMSLRFRVTKGFRQGKVFNANLTWGSTFVNEEGEIMMSDESSNKKLAIIGNICGLSDGQTTLLDEASPEDWALALNNCAGTFMSVQLKFWSNERVQEAYNLVQVRKN